MNPRFVKPIGFLATWKEVFLGFFAAGDEAEAAELTEFGWGIFSESFVLDCNWLGVSMMGATQSGLFLASHNLNEDSMEIRDSSVAKWEASLPGNPRQLRNLKKDLAQ